MDMRSIILSSLLALSLLLQTGCRTVIVKNKRFENMTAVSLIRPDDPSGIFNSQLPSADFKIESPMRDALVEKSEIENPYSLFRIKYHPSYSVNHWMVVEGSLASGRKYPVILDTGASVGLFVNDIHIMENKLAISPFQHYSGDSVGSGMCYLPELHIGQLTLGNWPCYYQAQHTELQLLGIPLAKGKAVIAGLETLRRFKYIAFDSVAKEVELSLKDTFKPEQPDLWTQYSFSIEEDLGGNVFLLVKIPIAGKVVELQLDTGSGRGLAISQELWDEIRRGIRHLKLRKGIDLYPYIGQLVCKRGMIPELEVGNRTVRNAMVSVFPDDSPIVDQCSGMLGMQYFQDTVMVLDFKRDLMWIRNSA
jgi:hypothetical protein